MQYNVGDRAAYLEPHEEGARIYEAEITSADGMRIGFRVGIDTEERWANVNDKGEALTSDPRIVPMDEVLQRELETHGSGFLLRTTLRDIEQRYESAEELAVQYQARMERWAIEQSQDRGEGYGFLWLPDQCRKSLRGNVTIATAH